MSKMTLKTEGDTQIVVTRRFAAAPEAVYRAHTGKPDSEMDAWSGRLDHARLHQRGETCGKIRFEWTNGKGQGFYLTGVCQLSRTAGSCTLNECTCLIHSGQPCRNQVRCR